MARSLKLAVFADDTVRHPSAQVQNAASGMAAQFFALLWHAVPDVRDGIAQTRKNQVRQGIFIPRRTCANALVVEMRGIEPLASAMRTPRSPS